MEDFCLENNLTRIFTTTAASSWTQIMDSVREFLARLMQSIWLSAARIKIRLKNQNTLLSFLKITVIYQDLKIVDAAPDMFARSCVWKSAKGSIGWYSTA